MLEREPVTVDECIDGDKFFTKPGLNISWDILSNVLDSDVKDTSNELRLVLLENFVEDFTEFIDIVFEG